MLLSDVMIIIMTIVICDIFFYDWIFVIVYCVACHDEVENCDRCAKEIKDKRATDGSNHDEVENCDRAFFVMLVMDLVRMAAHVPVSFFAVYLGNRHILDAPHNVWGNNIIYFFNDFFVRENSN